MEGVEGRVEEEVVEWATSETRVRDRNGRESHGETEERFIEELEDMVMEGLVEKALEGLIHV